MTSLEIADLVGSRHDDVKRAIETLVESVKGYEFFPILETTPKAAIQPRSGSRG